MRVALVPCVIDPESHGQLGEEEILRRGPHALYRPRNVEAGDLLHIVLNEIKDHLLRLLRRYGQSGVDINRMGVRNGIQDRLQRLQICKGLHAIQHKIAARCDRVDAPDTSAYRPQGTAERPFPLCFVDAEATSVDPLVGDQDCD